jgi:hypothetical protein
MISQSFWMHSRRGWRNPGSPQPLNPAPFVRRPQDAARDLVVTDFAMQQYSTNEDELRKNDRPVQRSVSGLASSRLYNSDPNGGMAFFSG